MTERILVTGGTGALGRGVVARLLEAGREVRVLSRRQRPDEARTEWATGDLLTGDGIASAVADVGVVVHCATVFAGGKEVTAARTLVEAARRAGSAHLVYVSIVGVDRIPFGYYQGKHATERLIADSGLPYTVLRATQFHDLLRTLFAVAAKSPVMPVPDLRFQPVDVGEVADRLAELATDEPAGRVADLGGPEVREARDLARSYLRATDRRRSILPVRLPGAAFRAYRAGEHLTPEHADGRVRFEDHLAAHPGPARLSYRGRR